MRETSSHVAFFGDQERTFSLTPPMIAELERTTGRGIGGLVRSIFASDFRLAEITETIRLGLIGGGETPQDAAALVKTYVEGRPVMEGYAVALSILETTMFGPAKPATTEEEPQADA